jgi:hypothetical protein
MIGFQPYSAVTVMQGKVKADTACKCLGYTFSNNFVWDGEASTELRPFNDLPKILFYMRINVQAIQP